MRKPSSGRPTRCATGGGPDEHLRVLRGYRIRRRGPDGNEPVWILEKWDLCQDRFIMPNAAMMERLHKNLG